MNTRICSLYWPSLQKIVGGSSDSHRERFSASALAGTVAFDEQTTANASSNLTMIKEGSLPRGGMSFPPRGLLIFDRTVC
ncbi:MAG: hypothetical protein OEY51_11470 [Cyclobacteriaceae bacterium]|nr:hypothetical protein [Cyclobacteriaceae bacterium]